MTGAVLRLSQAVQKVKAAGRKPVPEEVTLELRRAFTAAVPELLEAPAGSSPLEHAAAALRACHEAGVAVTEIAELQFGASSLYSLIGRN